MRVCRLGSRKTTHVRMTIIAEMNENPRERSVKNDWYGGGGNLRPNIAQQCTAFVILLSILYHANCEEQKQLYTPKMCARGSIQYRW